MNKRCSRCAAVKPVADFHRSRKERDGRHCWCGACQNEAHKAWRAAHPDHNRQRVAAWRDKARASGHLQRWQKGNNLGKYDLTVEQFEAMLVAQNGRCAICGEPETFIRQGKLCDLSVDHDHRTGAVRGLLCADCNRALGCVGDSPALLRAAADYLETHRGAGAPR